MKNHFPILSVLVPLLFLGSQVSAWLQETASQEAPPTRDEIQQAIEITKQHIASRKKRIEHAGADVKSLNARVEGSVDQITGMLTPVKDSQQSNYRVAVEKQKVIEALKDSIKDYDQLRTALRKETRERDPKITRDEIYDDIQKLDDKVNHRVEQIISLANSMDTWNDEDRYSLRYNDGWYGSRTNRSQSSRYRQNRSSSRRTEMERDKLIADIQDHLKRLQADSAKLKELIDNPKITEQYREMLQYEYDRNAELMELRRAQQVELASSTKPKTEAIGRNQMLNIEGLISDIADDLKKDYDSLFRAYTELNQERQVMKVLEERLEKYLKMLEEAEPAPAKK